MKGFWHRDSHLTWGDVVWMAVPAGMAVALCSLWLWEEVVRPWMHR